MARSVNQVTLIGNLAKDPELKTFDKTGGKLVNMRLITSESWRDKNTGEKREKADGHNIVIAVEALQNFAMKYLQKGSKIYVQGRLENRSWEKSEGGKGYATEVALRPFEGRLELLGGGKGASNSNGGGDAGSEDHSHNDNGQSNGNQGNGNQGNGGQGSGRGAPDLDDDIPF